MRHVDLCTSARRRAHLLDDLVHLQEQLLRDCQAQRFCSLERIRGSSDIHRRDLLAHEPRMRAVLELEGYGVQCAADGQEALDNLRHEERPALILLDLHMGGMDGWQFRDEQRKDGALAPIPVVVVSGTDDVSGSAQSLGAAGYLNKS